MKKWFKQKSTWTGIAAIVGAAGGLATGTIDVVTASQTIIGGFAIIFLRQAISK